MKEEREGKGRNREGEVEGEEREGVDGGEGGGEGEAMGLQGRSYIEAAASSDFKLNFDLSN